MRGWAYTMMLSALLATALVASVNADTTMGVAVSDTPDPVRRGNALTYRIAVTNSGNETATNVVVTDVLPSSVALDSCVVSQGTWSNDGGTVYCDMGNIAKGATGAVTIVCTPALEGVITNAVSVSARNSAGGRANAETEVIPPNRAPEIALPGPHVVWVGASTSFVVAVTDPDHDPAVTLTNTMKPAGASFNGTTFTWIAGRAFWNTTNWIEFVANDQQGDSNSVVTNRTALVVPFDGDADAMDDAWEWDNFETLTNAPAGDLDGDGMDNISEYIAGTQATNANSRFEAATGRAAAGYVVSWPWAAGRTYDVYRGTNLAETLQPVAIGLTGSSYTDNVSAVSRVYYRVRVVRP